MGGRGTFASGNSVALTYQNVEKIHDVWAVEGIKGAHSLPEESRNSWAYIKLGHDGIFKEMRIYDENHLIQYEIAYHKESKIQPNNNPVFHIHYYINGNRQPAEKIPINILNKYKQYYKGITKYD